ncbi:hypothetical protein ACIRPK_11515 [Kitasatospora sp. NPDC101801]|uniref:hypothetical protein n=1 Tax=Kitasatospora sp. NPDC101801 TaxID=3364103 RepID=UPI0037F23D61
MYSVPERLTPCSTTGEPAALTRELPETLRSGAAPGGVDGVGDGDGEGEGDGDGDGDGDGEGDGDG